MKLRIKSLSCGVFAQLLCCVQPLPSFCQRLKRQPAGVYALTATYGGLGGEKFEMLAAVFRDDLPTAENPNWNPTEVKDRDNLRRDQGPARNRTVQNNNTVT